jgi:hypothetical protein
MAQQLRAPTRATFDGNRDWLSALVETFDSAEHQSRVPCDAKALRAMHARLARPSITSAHSVPNRFARHDRRYSPASCNRGS